MFKRKVKPVRLCVGKDGWEKTGTQVIGYQWKKEDRSGGQTGTAMPKSDGNET